MRHGFIMVRGHRFRDEDDAYDYFRQRKVDQIAAAAAAGIVAVEAIDGRWNYGPATSGEAMKSEEFGVYGSADAALAAAGSKLKP